MRHVRATIGLGCAIALQCTDFFLVQGWDLVLSDLVMPELGGLELYEEVQQRGWRIPFLFMSGHGPEAVVSTEDPNQGFTFLEKPWTMDTLRTTVRCAMGERAGPS